MKIILSGGGTLGSVTPLIAIYEELKKQTPALEFLWLGTKTGPEKKLVESYGIEFRPILAVKWRRYFSWRNLLDIILLPAAMAQAFWVLVRLIRPVGQPQSFDGVKETNRQQVVILSAGGFVSVPLVWAGLLLRVPSIIHQQDVRPGLANILMAPAAKIITVTFAKSAKRFPAKKTVVVGNPVRADILKGDKNQAVKLFHLKIDVPTLLVLGGGTGALAINELLLKALPELVKFCQIIHQTGRAKTEKTAKHDCYHPYEFITDNLKHAFAAADLVITRAGMSTLSELAALKKPTIIIPIPNSHQVDNAVEFEKNNAAVVLEQNNLDASRLAQAVKSILSDSAQLQNLSRNIGKILPPDAAQQILKIILNSSF